jgi:hypothetical protein
MNLHALSIAIVAAVVTLFFVIVLERWWVSWYAHRVAKRIVEKPRNSLEPCRLIPESLYVVELSESGVSCTRPSGTIESVKWSDLQRVELMTTGDGPFAPDVFWLLYGSRSGCVVPQGAKGEQQLRDRLAGLPGFNWEPAIEAMKSTMDQRFLCWEKTKSSA